MRVTSAKDGLSYHVVPRPHCTIELSRQSVAQSHSVGVFQAEHPGEPMPLAPLLAISALAREFQREQKLARSWDWAQKNPMMLTPVLLHNFEKHSKNTNCLKLFKIFKSPQSSEIPTPAHKDERKTQSCYVLLLLLLLAP